MQTFVPTVSVILPVYNAEKYVADAIRSVLNQSYHHWELIVIDDGSTDRTRKIITPFLEDERIQYIHKTNGGPASARNMGVDRALGTYLAFLDADDLWDKHKLQVQITVMLKEDPCLVFSQIRCIDKHGGLLGKNIGSGAGFYQGFEAFFLLAGGSIAIPNSSVLVKKACVERVGGFKEGEFERNIEDYDLWFMLLLDGNKIFGMRRILGSYRKHEAQITHNDSGQNLKMSDYLERLSRQYPGKKAFFKFLILQRLSTYYVQHSDKKEICLQKFYSNSCLNTYWFEKHLINLTKFHNYLRFRKLLIRRFRRFKNFVALINN